MGRRVMGDSMWGSLPFRYRVTTCENCAAPLLWYDRLPRRDGIGNVYQGWWEVVSWSENRTTWQAHTPKLCREARRARLQVDHST